MTVADIDIDDVKFVEWHCEVSSGASVSQRLSPTLNGIPSTLSMAEAGASARRPLASATAREIRSSTNTFAAPSLACIND